MNTFAGLERQVEDAACQLLDVEDLINEIDRDQAFIVILTELAHERVGGMEDDLKELLYAYEGKNIRGKLKQAGDLLQGARKMLRQSHI